MILSKAWWFYRFYVMVTDKPGPKGNGRMRRLWENGTIIILILFALMIVMMFCSRPSKGPVSVPISVEMK